MSQFWHSHWAEDAYKPGLLGNWQVPNWHPKWPCVRHCVTTTFLADKSGRLLPDKPKPKRSPWGDFKGTWELPLKIDRKLAHKLSAPPKHKLAAWEAHKLHYEGPCGITTASQKTKEKPTAQSKRRKSPAKSPDRTKKLPTKTKRIVDRNKEKTAKNKSKEAKKTVANAKTKKAEKTIADSKSKDLEKTIANSKTKEADETMVKTKGSTARRRAIDKIEDEPEVDRLDAKTVSDKSEASERDQSTVNEEPYSVEEESIIEEPGHEEESTVTEESEYNDHDVVSEKSTAERKGRKDRGKEKRTECLCQPCADSKSLEKIVPKEARHICTVHQRLRV